MSSPPFCVYFIVMDTRYCVHFFSIAPKQAVTETIRICKDRNILKQYLSSKEVEGVTIMMSLFDDEQIMRTYAKDMARDTTKRNVITMLKKGRISVEEIPAFFPELLEGDIKELEAEVMQLA